MLLIFSKMYQNVIFFGGVGAGRSEGGEPEFFFRKNPNLKKILIFFFGGGGEWMGRVG